ncbi:2-octaprenyl-3-methyl-6-methoxy-1,4-benzoquinol hydroxylase [Iodidimonas gelatinilytica]|uniref:2-octaprenyl-3-methyl-6-methoxy-1,4-benzoquinol hydroxylase n=1 Tax=Iodidimonas gelatinilytica TaxID=1236966 RepID=A0A5A7N1H6_9PROT|nr:UbiH/UbiF/VisC/COQ6 family ubiquinone biosynthesis hydroxylase [Iodidimonas gelatinilytica]GER01575.1 2-octaprenyl-3-methyl-6-methoxy-1,4-benzoquinol hydroxylase [Iodidimonas gelatinilytica]
MAMDGSSSKAAPDLRVDVAIVGGGMAGLTAACGLAQYGLEIAVIDTEAPQDLTAQTFDGRCSAIAYASVQMLKSLKIWPPLEDTAQPIKEIRVSDGESRHFLHFDFAQIGNQPLGEMVENRHLRQALFFRASQLGNLHLLAPARVEAVTRDQARAHLVLKDGRTVSAALAIGADGRNSRMRQQAAIQTPRWRYNQVGIVATVAHELPHCAIAHERFLPDGPFAILPLTGNRSSLVWTARASSEKAIMGLSPRAFEAEVQRRMGDFLGKATVCGPRWSYPLGLHMAERYIDTRLALIGDAAHGIHPIAGQGLNMGLRDIAALIEVLVEAARRGEDIGSPFVLERYQRWRRTDNVVLALVTDTLNRLFSNDIAPIRHARDLGLSVVNRLPVLKRFFMSHARGTVGKLPRLLEGHPL